MRVNKNKKIVISASIAGIKRAENFPEWCLAKYFAENQREVILFCYPAKDEEPLIHKGIKVMQYKRLAGISLKLMLDIFLLRRDIEAIYLFQIRTDINWVFCVLKKLRLIKSKIIFIPNGIFHDEYIVKDRDFPFRYPHSYKNIIFNFKDFIKKPSIKQWRNYIFHMPFKAADAVIAWGEYERKEIVENMRIDSKSIFLHHPVNVKVERRKTENSSYNLLYIGQIKKRKGWDIAIKAVKLLKEEYPKIKLIFVTYDSVRLNSLKELISREDAQDYIDIRLRIKDTEKWDLYKKCSVLVFPTRYEGFGLPVIEAMMKGCAVVASDSPAVNEIVKHEENGLIAKYESPEDTAQQVARLLDSVELRQRIISNAYETALEYDYKKCCKQLEMFVNDIQ